MGDSSPNLVVSFNPASDLSLQTRGLDFEGLLATLETAQGGDVVVLHACCHNPTGIDPSREQWIELCEFMSRKRLIPFFDAA